jgi:hypothetical protein
VRDATTQAATLVDTIATAEARYHDAWPTFTTLVAQAEGIGRTLLASSREARLARAELQELTREFALTIAMPHRPVAPADAARTHYLALVLAAVAAGHEPSETVETYLRSEEAASA